MKNDFGFTRAELAILQQLKTPAKIQAFLDDDVLYNRGKASPTCRGPRRVLRDRVAHCAEGAFLAAAALRVQGFAPLILDLEAVRDDDHVLAVYQQHGHWGALAKSNYAGLRFREPVYRTLRELALSYFEHYYNEAGEKTLRTYSRPVNLRRFDRIEWMTTEEDLWEICEYLCEISHTRIMTPLLESQRRKMDKRLYEAGLVGAQ